MYIPLTAIESFYATRRFPSIPRRSTRRSTRRCTRCYHAPFHTPLHLSLYFLAERGIPRAVPRAVRRAIPHTVPHVIPRAVPRAVPGAVPGTVPHKGQIHTLTFVLWSKPSIWFSSSSRIRCTSRSAPVCASKRLVAMASISSMKITLGEFSLARRNTSRTMRGPSPRYFCTNSDPTWMTKVRGNVFRASARGLGLFLGLPFPHILLYELRPQPEGKVRVFGASVTRRGLGSPVVLPQYKRKRQVYRSTWHSTTWWCMHGAHAWRMHTAGFLRSETVCSRRGLFTATVFDHIRGIRGGFHNITLHKNKVLLYIMPFEMAQETDRPTDRPTDRLGSTNAHTS